MDGPAKITQPPVPTSGTYTYEFDVGQHGSYFYHTYDHADRQQAFGLDGALIIRPKNPAQEAAADIEYVIQLQEWLKREWLTYPAMLMEGGLPNYFTINGKAWPATEKIQMRVRQTVKLRFIGTNNNFVHLCTCTAVPSRWSPSTAKRCRRQRDIWLTRSMSVRGSASM